jgi:serine/threonine-protein kinase HipA
MAAKDSRLAVFANLSGGWVPCSQLQLTETANTLIASSLAYGLNYLKRSNAIEIDPVGLGLSDRQAIQGVRLQPPNRLAFFGGIRDAAPDAWGRRVIEAKLKVPANSLPESQYLLHAGSERVGALDIRATLNDAPNAATGQLHTLAYLMEAAQRIEAGLPVPAQLDAIFINGTAMGGARPKASVRDESDVLWLAKFASGQDRIDVPLIEYAALQLGREASLNVPPVRTLQVGDRRVMMIRRFDRYWASTGELPTPHIPFTDTIPTPGAAEHRLAFNSGLTWVGCDESESREKSYGDLAEAIRRYAHPSVIRSDNAELFKRMIFNILVSNDDDHLRNHGFIWDPRLPGWRLSPLYDVMPRPSLATERFLHLGIGPQGRVATLDNALASHARFTLSEREAALLICQVWGVVREWRVYFERDGVPDSETELIAPAFRHIDTVSSHELRRKLP